MTLNVLKHCSRPIRWLFRPTLMISVALHSLVLFIPRTSPDEQSTETNEVFLDVVPLPESSVESNEDEILENMQAAEIARTPSDPQSQKRATSLPLDVQPDPSELPVPDFAELPSVVAPPSPSVSPELSSTPPEPELPPSLPLPFSNFPHLASGESGCFGLGNCRQINGGNFRQVSADLIEQLGMQGYDVRSRDDIEDSGIKVYEVSKDHVTQYLSVLQPELGVSVYVLAAEPVTTSELQLAESLKAKFDGILQTVSNGEQAQYAHFADPHFFFEGTVPRPEIGNALYTVMNIQPDRLAIPLINQLTAEGFTVEPIGEYAGAPFYEVIQGAFVAYLSMMTTEDSTGTILVGWNRLPEQQQNF